MKKSLFFNYDICTGCLSCRMSCAVDRVEPACLKNRDLSPEVMILIAAAVGASGPTAVRLLLAGFSPICL